MLAEVGAAHLCPGSWSHSRLSIDGLLESAFYPCALSFFSKYLTACYESTASFGLFGQ